MYEDPNENDYQGGYKGYLGTNQNLPFGENVSDEENVKTINEWIRESKTWHDVILLYQNMALRYYLGDQTEKAGVAAFNSNTVYNRIFEGTETIVPIVTGTAHQFISIPGDDSELALKKSQKVQKVLSRKYEELMMTQKLENIVRDIILKRFGVAEWYWNPNTDDVDIRVIDPRLVLIPKLRLDANDPELPYVLVLEEYTREEIKINFPDVNPEDLVFGRIIETGTPPMVITQNQAPVYQVVKATTNEYIVWKQADKVLKKMVSPYYDFEGEEEQKTVTKENGKIKKVTYRKFYNHFDTPRKNYVFFNPFTTGDAPVAETSLAEIAMPIQDDINVQKRQIINNLVKMGNGQVYIDSDAIPKELADQITSEPGLVIEGKNLASENRIRREPGTPLPTAHFQNLQDSILSFDNVFGTHGAVRGSGGSKTLGGQIIDKQQDLSRIESITRCVNRGVALLANGLVQLMKLYYNEEHVVKILGKNGAIEFIRFTRNDIDDNIVVEVKSGTPPTLDPIGRYNQGIQLWQLGAIDPETLFERLDFADPQEAAKKLAAWKQGQLLMESQIKQAEAAAGAAAKGGAPGGGAPAEGARDVETPGDVITRAKEALGKSGSAPLKNTPNGGQPLAIA